MGNVQFNRFRAMSRRVESPVVLSPTNFEKPNHHRFEAAQLSLRSRWRAEVVRLRFCSANSDIHSAILSMKGGTMFQRLLQHRHGSRQLLLLRALLEPNTCSKEVSDE